MGDLTRQKPRTEWTAQENLDYMRTGAVPEDAEYVERRREVLEAAGLEPDIDATPIADMSPAQHLDRIQKENR